MIARNYRVDEGSVKMFARLLKEAGLLSMGARGINAPHMLPLDAARLTLALLSTDSPARCVDRVRRFGPMKIAQSMGDPPKALIGDGDVTLEKVLVRAFCFDRNNIFNLPYVEVNENYKSARMEFSKGAWANFKTTEPDEDLMDSDRAERPGIRRTRALPPHELTKVALELWVDRFRGEDDEGRPLDALHPSVQSLPQDARLARISEIDAFIDRRDVDWRKRA